MTERHLRPGAGGVGGSREPKAEEPEELRVPWELRDELGWSRAAVRTVGLIARHPVRAFNSIEGRGGYVGPFLFALIVAVVASLLSEMTTGLYELVFDPQGSQDLAELFGIEIGGEPVAWAKWLPVGALGMAGFAGCLLGLLLAVPILFLILPVLLVVWSGTLHLCLWLVGGLSSSETGFQGTWAGVCYATPAFLLGVFPVIGDGLIFIGLGILQAIGFWRLHRTTPLRAIVALLLPFSIPLALWLMKNLGWLGQPGA